VDVPADLRITITDVRRAGYCASGARRWFEANGFDFRAFLKDGIPAPDLLATGDALAQRAVAAGLERSHG
jgi:hypothetical protein